jgi:long-chain fatty acid transport protein
MSLPALYRMKTKTKFFKFWGRWSAVLAPACVVVNSHADGVEGTSTGTSTVAKGGTDLAWSSYPLGATANNSTDYGYLESPQFNLSVDTGLLSGHPDQPGVSNNDSDYSLRASPNGVIASPFKDVPFSIGVTVIPESMLLSDWNYMDPSGGLDGGPSHSYQDDASEIFLLRSALGAAVQINERLSLGASVGLLYNNNPFVAPNVFQDLSPAGDLPYDSANTLWNFQSAGVGWNVMVGLVFKATSDVQFGLSYRSASAINSTGNPSGDPFAQFDPRNVWVFDYNEDIKDKFPKQWSGGASWKFSPKWRADMQVDWINWYNAFEVLPFVGYNWGNTKSGTGFSADTFVYRAGLEYELNDRLALRAGYAYGQNPMPDSTFLPMTGDIMEHTVNVGIGYHWRRLHVDLAYQYALPMTQNISNNPVDVTSHMVALSAGIRF